MLKKFFSLEWKSFLRSASFRANMFIKIIMVLAALYFILIFTGLGIGLFYILKKQEMEPLETVNRFIIFYLLLDLVIRYFLQKMPVMNIRPFLVQNISRKSIVGYSLGKTMVSIFNILHLFFLLPFTIVLIVEGYDPLGATAWFIGILSVVYLNNFLNILSNNRSFVLYSVALILVLLALFTYYGLIDLTQYTQPLFGALYTTPWVVIVPVLLLVIVSWITFRFFLKNLYLDAGLKVKEKAAQTEHYTWLNRYGVLGTFIKNDIKLIKRNKRSRTTIIMSVLFIFYGLLFFTGGIEAYEGPVWRIFAGIFVTGGFIFTFGQFVPSWDSSYYPLMMSQNIQYREYLNSKWWLMVITTIITTMIAGFYLYFGWEVYQAILVGAVYNIGVNAHLVLLGGAYIRTPIDLTQNKNVMGNKQAFNSKTLLLTLPKLILPLGLYALGHYLFEPIAGYLMVAGAGIIGFAFKNKVFVLIERIYKTEKYKTIAAYSQKA
ncbi:hypothetical protein FK178_02475 [Antarcticibacterium arcticum]|uniref:Uncharacterized protein n=1 Tax=Antarcticibacterium arcticum TaxID=2585771 RepID=A0A5B8YFF5_9FLAO|nr:DUF5687 family protein [Antarcticibacterium arcticum]QED36645.1 hypothetical protein FK178_02475 [Antarcticibacterium arcticum]